MDSGSTPCSGRDVAIVGAGPVGLLLALRLAKLGVPVTLLESARQFKLEGSKACLIQGDVLDMLNRIGCADSLMRRGVSWDTSRTYIQESAIRTIRFPRKSEYGPFLNISQSELEKTLLDQAVNTPGIKLLWHHRLINFRQDREQVEVQCESQGQRKSMKFSYLVGCDGVRSSVRNLANIRWMGYTHSARFLITDIKANLPLEAGRHFHFNPKFNRGRQVVLHPQPDNIWRIDWQLADDADVEGEQISGEFENRVQAVIGEVPFEIKWLSTYRFQQRIAERFQVRRVFLAGDAAHALPPYGSRGLNSGIADADNLAWKLAAVYQGRAGADFLETYHRERYPAAQENLRITESTIKFMVPRGRRNLWLRNWLLRTARWVSPLRRWVNSGTLSTPFHYPGPRGSRTREALVGSFAPDGPLDHGPRLWLRGLLGSRYTALVILTATNQAQAAMAGAVKYIVTDEWLHRIAILAPGFEPTDAVRRGLETAGFKIVPDFVGVVSQIYGRKKPVTWLIRPDGHIADSTSSEAGINLFPFGDRAAS